MATDKRLDQVSTLTDFDYALIVKGDQVAKASKQQLAELVGNLLYGATTASSLAAVVTGLMLGASVGKITAGSDFLNLNAGSFYITGSEIGTMVNVPSGLPTTSRFRVFVINHASKEYQTIYLFNNSYPYTWVAKKNGGSNITWSKITSEIV